MKVATGESDGMANITRRQLLTGTVAAAAGFSASRGVAAPISPDVPGSGPLSIAAIGELLTQYKVPGASLAIADKGELVATYCYGLAQAERAVTPQTLFQAASISKTANALAVLQLAAAGRFGLDDPVNAHLTSWKLPDNALTETTPVTARMLLSHTGGTTVPGFAGYLPGSPLPTLREILDGTPPANSAPVRVEWPPGSAFHYSGGGITVLQQMVIDVTGQSYAEALDRLVLRPLTMAESSDRQEYGAGDLAGLALAHGPDGSLNPGGFRIHPELAAAGLWTTPRDLMRMVLGIIGSWNGAPGAFLAQNFARQMLVPVKANSGLGVFIDADGVFSHLGSNIGYRALYAGDVKTGKAMVVMTNGDNGEGACDEVRKRVAQVYGWS
jgi:CubicO group peptidase (beta-lactamase class C family)